MRTRTKKLGLILAMIATLSMALPVQAKAATDGVGITSGSVSGGDTTVSGGDDTTGSGGDDTTLPGGGDTTVSGGDGTTEPGGDDTTPDEDEIPDADVDLSGKTVNLALVVDITGSMYSYINGVKENLIEFVRFIESSGVNFRISLIDYRDITCGEPTNVHRFSDAVWCEDADLMVEELSKLSVNGGGDYEESVIDALGFVVDEETMTFNSDAAKFAIVLTDADYKEENTHGIADMNDMIDRLNAKDIKVSVMTGSWCFETYKDLTEKTGGIICPVSDFNEALQAYALAIIKATADSKVDESVVAVTGIEASGPAKIHPGYGYTYTVKINPANATDKGIFWTTEDASIAEVVYASGTECTVIGVAEGTTRLIAESRDGGYTSSVEITVTEEAEASGSFITSDYDKVIGALGEDEITKVEYCVSEDKGVPAEEQKELFTALKGTKKTMSIAFSDGDSKEKTLLYKWTFYGEDITDADKTIDFTTEIGKKDKDILDAVDKAAGGKDVEAVDIHFEHDGDLPGKASVTVNVKDLFKEGTKLALYYYNPKTGELEETASDISIEDGYATFPLEHCSDYVLISEKVGGSTDTPAGDGGSTDTPAGDDGSTITPTPTPTPSGSATGGSGSNNSSTDAGALSPKTGDNGIMGYLLLAMLSVLAFVYCGKKVRQTEE